MSKYREDSILPNGTSRLSVTSDLLSYPIANLPDEPIANFFKSLIKNHFSLSSLEVTFTLLLNDTIFGGQNINLIKQKYKNFNISFDVICGKTIPKKTAHYFCLDCDRVSREEKALVGAMCQECFIGSHHEGHRVILRKNKFNITQCYCGDSSIFESSAFCKQHAKQALAYEEVQAKLEEAFITKFTNTLKIALYGICALAELYEKGKDTPKRTALRETLGVLLDQLLEFCNFCSNDLSSMFLVVLSRLFMSKFLPDYNKLWHYCNDLKGKKGLSSQEMPCNCCIFEVFLRHISLVDSCIQLVFLFRNLSKDNDFRQFMAVIYVKYLHFIFLNDNPKRRSLTLSHSRFAKTSLELYAGSDLCEAALKSGYTIHIFEILQDVLLKCTCLQGRFKNLVYELKVLLEYLMRPHTNSCKLVLRNSYILIVMVDLLSGFGDCHTYQSPITLKMAKDDINYSFINDSLQCEGLVSGILRRAILQLDELEETERESGLNKLCLYWKETYNQKLRKDKKKEPNKYCFHPVLERLLQHIIRENKLEVSKEAVSTFITKKLDINETFLAENMIEGLVKPIGALKHIAYFDNNAYDQVSSTYHCPLYNLFDNDILSIQMFLPYIPRDKVYEILVKSYFSYSKEIVDFLLDSEPLPKENLAHLTSLIQEFFQFLIYIMTDEISLANNLFTREPQYYVDQHENNEKIKKITKKVIVNILSCYTWIDLATLITQVKSVLHIKNIDDALAEVAILDEKTQKLRIKEDYYHDYDPYMFYGRKTLQNELKVQFLERVKGSANIDLLSGFYYTGLSDHLYEIQQALLSGPMFDFVVKLFLDERDEYEGLRHIGLKLLLTTLNCSEYLINCSKESTEMLKQIKANFGDGSIMERLSNLKEEAMFGDCGIIIENISESIERLKEFEVESSPAIPRLSTLMVVSQKNSQPEEKKKDLINNNFHKESIEAYKKKKIIGKRAKSNEFSEEHELMCSYCSKSIDVKEGQYGMPVFVTLTNNVGKLVHAELESARYPVIFSCLHFFHDLCISQATKSSNQDKYSNLFRERGCPVCNTTYNYFMLVNSPSFDRSQVLSAPIQPVPILSVLGYMVENSDWYEEEALQELSDEPDYTRPGLVAACSSFMFFLDTLDFSASFEQLVKDVETFSWVMRTINVFLQRDREDIELLFKGRKFNASENPEKILCTTAMQTIVLHAHDERIFMEKIKKLLSEYIIKKALEKIALTHEKSSYNTNKLLFKLFDSALTISLKNAKLYHEVVHVLRKIAVIYVVGISLYTPVKSDKIQMILQTLYDPETCTPKDLLALLDIQVKPEEFLKDLLFNVDASNSEPNYSKEDGKKLKTTDGVLFNLYKLDPCIIDLPKTYLEFISKYFKSRCGCCNQVPPDGEDAICLMCGEIFCLRKCHKPSLEYDNGFSLEGNLSRHRRKKHAGTGLFLEISTLMIIMIYGNRTLCYMGLNLYCDGMGQNVKNVVAHPFDRQLDSLDFRRFYLGKEAHSYLQRLVKRSIIPIQQTEMSRNNDAVFSGNEI